MDLIRDLLDKEVVDRHGREMGRVDRIVVELRDGQPPRVAAIEIGPSALGTRLHPRLGRSVAAIELALGLSEPRPMRIDFADVIDVHDHVRVDCAAGETSPTEMERRLRRWVAALPRSS